MEQIKQIVLSLSNVLKKVIFMTLLLVAQIINIMIHLIQIVFQVMLIVKNTTLMVVFRPKMVYMLINSNIIHVQIIL